MDAEVGRLAETLASRVRELEDRYEDPLPTLMLKSRSFQGGLESI